MYAANLEGQVAYTLEQNDISEPIVIPTKAAEYISSFPFNSKLELLVSDSVLTVKSGRNRAKFSLFDVNTYPKKLRKRIFSYQLIQKILLTVSNVPLLLVTATRLTAELNVYTFQIKDMLQLTERN